MFCCDVCGSADCCERTDLIGEPVLCDVCYSHVIYGEVNCDACSHSYYEGDKLRCELYICKPKYNI